MAGDLTRRLDEHGLAGVDGCGAPHGDRIQYCDLRMEPAQNAIDANLNHERLVREHESKLAAQSRRDCIREPREQPFGHVSEDYQP